MNNSKCIPNHITNYNKYCSFSHRLLVSVVTVVFLAFSPTAVLAADIIGTSGTPLIINTDQSGNNAYGVKETGNDAEGGIVDVQPGGIIDNARGGYSETGIANNNQATVSGGTVNETVYGGRSDYISQNNQVSISGGVIAENAPGVVFSVVGGASEITADSNSVSISGGTINGLMITGGGGMFNAQNNQVSISGGIINAFVIGGFSANLAQNNHVTISGGIINSGIFAGAVDHDIAGVINNTLTITGGTFANSVVIGGYSIDANINPIAFGNTINLKVSGLSIDNIVGVNNLHFYLPDSVQNGDTVMILNDQDVWNTGISGTDLTNTVIGVCAAAGSALNDGDVITLINAQNLSTSSNNPVNDTSNMTGCSPVYQFALEKDNNNLIARVTKAAVATYTIGGTVSGLSGTLVLQNNGGDNLTMSADGSFTFATAVIDGNGYSVSILSQPTGQTCTVNNASGTVNGANINTVSVTCQATAAPQPAAQPVPGLGGKALALLMLLLAAMTAWFIHRRSATAV